MAKEEPEEIAPSCYYFAYTSPLHHPPTVDYPSATNHSGALISQTLSRAERASKQAARQPGSRK